VLRALYRLSDHTRPGGRENFLRGKRGGREEEGRKGGRKEGEREKGRGERGFK